MTKEELKQRLAAYKPLQFEVEQKLDRLARMKSDEQLPATRESDASKSTGGKGDRMERAILRRMEWEEKNLPQIEAARREMADLEAIIDGLEDPMGRECLRLRYLDGEDIKLTKWLDVAIGLFGGDDDKYIKAAFRILDAALTELCKKGEEKDAIAQNLL